MKLGIVLRVGCGTPGFGRGEKIKGQVLPFPSLLLSRPTLPVDWANKQPSLRDSFQPMTAQLSDFARSLSVETAFTVLAAAKQLKAVRLSD